MKFNREYVCSIMPDSLLKEEQQITKQWKKIQKEIIWRAKRGFHTYNCWYGHYDDKIYDLLKQNNFQVNTDWASGQVEVRW